MPRSLGFNGARPGAKATSDLNRVLSTDEDQTSGGSCLVSQVSCDSPSSMRLLSC